MHYRNTIPKSQIVNRIRHTGLNIGTSALYQFYNYSQCPGCSYDDLNHTYIVNDNCNKCIQIKFVTTNSIFLSTLNWLNDYILIFHKSSIW